MIKTILVLSDGTEIFAGHNRINAIQSTSIMESSNDGEDLTLGSVCAKKIEIKIITPKNKLPIKSGDLIMVYEEENGVRRKKGNFIAEKPQKKGANTTNIVAYDNISLLDKDVTEWFNSLEGFPYTAYDMAKKVCQYCGINFANANINNGDYLIYATQLKSVTARQIVRWIGEISGCFCVADENGNAVYQWYKENSTPIVASRSENAVTFLQGGLSYEDYQTNKVDRVQIRQDKNSVGIVFPNGASGENSYIIESNPFLIEDARMVDIAESLYNIIKDITYVPCKVNVPSSYKFNVGDIVKITDTNGVEFYSYIMQKKRAGQKETLECTGNYTRNGATTLYNTSYTAGYGRDLEISKDLAKLELTTSENESKISLIVQDDKASGSLIIGAINDESYAKINADRLDIEGKTLNIKVDATNIEGKMTARQINADGLEVERGKVGGWLIENNSIISENKTVGLYSYAEPDEGTNNDSHSTAIATSLIDGTHQAIRFFAGASSNSGLSSATFQVLSDGSLYATAAKLEGDITAKNGYIGSWTITPERIRSNWGVYGTYEYTTTGTDLKVAEGYAFTSLEVDGIYYIIKKTRSFESETLVTLSLLTGRAVIDNSGGIA